MKHSPVCCRYCAWRLVAFTVSAGISALATHVRQCHPERLEPGNA
jgi:putative component of membrane protein insertase Oxa1/YidC/SpoIIIJ protein YidD